MNTFPRIFCFAGLSCLVLSLGAPAARNAIVVYDDDVIALSMEISALQVLHDLRVTPAQIQMITKMVKETAQKMPDRKTPKVSDKMLKVYQDLRQALLDADEDKINELMADLEDLLDSEKVELDDDFDLSDNSRKNTEELLSKLTARQVAIYLSQFADEFPDPLEKITEAIEESRSRRGKYWTDYRNQTAGQVGWLVGGLEKASEDKVREAVIALLDKANKMDDAEYKTKKKDLETASKEIIATTAPTQILKNFMLRTLAELLSNPRTTVALEARLKKAK